MRNKYVAEHVMRRYDMFYYVRHIPTDLANHYSVKRLCFRLTTKSLGYAINVVLFFSSYALYDNGIYNNEI